YRLGAFLFLSFAKAPDRKIQSTRRAVYSNFLPVKSAVAPTCGAVRSLWCKKRKRGDDDRPLDAWSGNWR
ncbi:TPA: hypothetical protein ACGR4L_000558, partial [Serratia marcescens]